jgi:hypothetical protein
MINSRPRPTTCAYCGGPLPPPAVTGRPRTFCSAQCRRANEEIVTAQKVQERQRREQERREAEWQEREKAREAKAEREYQRALKAGGRVAGEAKWERAYDQALDAGFGLCQWEEEIEEEGYQHVCFNRTRGDTYCHKHNRHLERESAKPAPGVARKLSEKETER